MISRKTRFSMLPVLALAVMALALIPKAATIGEAHDLIQLVRTTLDGVDIGGRNPDRARASLDSKLYGADIKLDQYKACDAFDKMVDFRDQVSTMAVPNRKGETKIDPGDAGQLVSEAQDAIDCILQLDPTCDDL